MKVLFIGESWLIHTQEAKGFDVFTFDTYETATEWIERALTSSGIEFCHLPSHLIEKEFPENPEALRQYDAVLLSDVGANTFNLPMAVFQQLKAVPNKLQMLRDYALQGGGLGMIGGYLSFMGIQGRGAYKHTAMEEALPINLLPCDDRMEHPEGVAIEVAAPAHPVFEGVPKSDWPKVLGYNKLLAKEDAEVVATCCGDPMIVLREYGKGRTLAYATDCSPHWSPLEFCQWEAYSQLWRNLIEWLSHKR